LTIDIDVRMAVIELTDAEVGSRPSIDDVCGRLAPEWEEADVRACVQEMLNDNELRLSDIVGGVSYSVPVLEVF
jgi:hypothetical protein